MRVVIVGGVAGGMSAATRLRRLDETAEIIILEKGPMFPLRIVDYHTISAVRLKTAIATRANARTTT